MHDDDLPDDDIRNALERRARRAEPAGADSLLARSDEGAAPERRGRGAWMAAAAVLVLLGGLVGYVASVGESEPDQVAVTPAGDGPRLVSPTIGDLQRGVDEPIDCELAADMTPVRGQLACVPGGGAAQLTQSVADLVDRFGGQRDEVRILVANGTWGRTFYEYARALARSGPPDLSYVPEPPLTQSSVWYGSDAGMRLAVELGDLFDVSPRSLDDVAAVPPLVLDESADLQSYDLVLIIGADVDPAGVECGAIRDPGICDPLVLDSYPDPLSQPQVIRDPDQPSILHPPAEVRVLLLNGTAVAGAAGRLSDQLQANRGYNTLTPGNAIEPSVASFAYYVPGYELDARQIAQILDLMPESVQPLPPEVIPAETEGDPHVVVVVGDDLVG